MTQAKHTAGPWHWVNPTTDEPRQKGEMQSSLRTVWEVNSPFGDYTLPKIILDAEFWKEDGMEEDARLIAAAPDLLGALKRMIAHSCVADAGSDMKDAEDHAAERMALAAIAKAEGRS